MTDTFQRIVVYLIEVFKLFFGSQYYGALFLFVLIVCVVLFLVVVFGGSKHR